MARFYLGEVANPDCEWLLAQGDADDVVPAAEVLAWAARQSRPPRLHVLAGAGHFFHGRLHELKPLVVEFLRARKRENPCTLRHTGFRGAFARRGTR